MPFLAPPSAFNLGFLRSESEEIKVRRELVDLLARLTAREVAIYAAPSKVISSIGMARPGDWVITGQITKADQGSRLLRTGVGFGLGETRFQTKVIVLAYEASGLRRVLEFSTKGGSGKLPGAVVGFATGATAVELAAGSVLGIFPGLTADADRTAYEIAAAISYEFNNRGWLDSTRAEARPKLEGRWSGINSRRFVPQPIRELSTPRE